MGEGGTGDLFRIELCRVAGHRWLRRLELSVSGTEQRWFRSVVSAASTQFSGVPIRLTGLQPPGILSLATSGSSSVVEHRLAKARVASSNLVSRSIPPSGTIRVGYGGMERSAYNSRAALPRRGTQVVRERSAKPLCVGSIPTRASKFPQPLTQHPEYAGPTTGAPLREFPA